MSYGQLTTQLIQIKSDTVLYLTKPQSVYLSNYILSNQQLTERFKTALKREDMIRLLWIETGKQLDAQIELNKIAVKKVELCDEQLEKVIDLSIKDKRNTAIKTGVVALALGFVTGILIGN